MPSFSPCGLVCGLYEHHLDHIAPLCSELSIPLIVTEPFLKDLAKAFYNNLDILFIPQARVSKDLLETFNCIISSLPKPTIQSLFFLSDTPRSIWCPHGLSDKGLSGPYFEALKREEALFIYGKRTYEHLKSKEVIRETTKTFPLGNYRKGYFLKNRNFYNSLIEEKIFSKLKKEETILLYAPTWNDLEGYASFEKALPTLIDTLPENIQLIVKLHPNTLEKGSLWLDKILSIYENHPRVLFLNHFPAIYPLIDIISAYIADASSIGYDCITLRKPLFFLKNHSSHPELPLYRCGKVIEEKDFPFLYDMILLALDHPDEFLEPQLETLEENFYRTPNFYQLSQELKLFFDHENHRPLHK